MTVRPAVAGDLKAIMGLEQTTFHADAWSEPMMREELTSPHGQYLVLEQAGRIVGYGGVRAPRGGTDADIQTIAIAEAARGRGQGRALLEALLAEARQRGARAVFLEVRADNPVAQRLYESEGFAVIGRRPRYYQPDDVDAVVMKLELRGWTPREPKEPRNPSRLQGETAHAGAQAPAEAISPCTRDAGGGSRAAEGASRSADGASRAAEGRSLATEGGWCS